MRTLYHWCFTTSAFSQISTRHFEWRETFIILNGPISKTTAQFFSLTFDHMQLINQKTSNEIKPWNEMLINQVYISWPLMHHGIKLSLAISLPFLLSLTINDCYFCFNLSHPFQCHLFYSFSFLSSKVVLLRLAHQPLDFLIFCRVEKHLNLSLRLFITCPLHFCLQPLFLSVWCALNTNIPCNTAPGCIF